jgi:hypothetical protein
VTRPSRSVPPPHPGYMAGMKRSAEYVLTCGKPVITVAPGVSGRRTVDGTVSGEVEIGSDGTVLKRAWQS